MWKFNQSANNGFLRKQVSKSGSLVFSILFALAGLGSTLWISTPVRAQTATRANNNRVDVTLNRQPNEAYETLIGRAEAAARSAVSRTFNQNPSAREVSVTILGQNAGAIVPVLSLQVARQTWSSSQDVQRLATYFPNSRSLLGLGTPGSRNNNVANQSQPTNAATAGQTLPNGVRVLPNGTVVTGNGVQVLPNGIVVTNNGGTQVLPNGNVLSVNAGGQGAPNGTNGTTGVGVNGTNGVGVNGTTGVGVNGTNGVGNVNGATGVGNINGTTGVGVNGTTGVGNINGTTGVGVNGTTGVGVNGTTGIGVNGTTGIGVNGTTGVGVNGTTGVGVNGTTGIGGSAAGTTGIGGSAAGTTGIGGSAAGTTGIGGSATGGNTGVGGATGTSGGQGGF